MSVLNQSFGNFVKTISTDPSATFSNSFILARVTHVVRGPYYLGTTDRDPFYLDPTSLGEITYQVVSGIQDTSQEGNITARPIFSAFKQYPLEGELVYIMPGPSVNMNVTRNAIDMFYFPPYNLWNAVNHNAFPNLAEYQNYVDVVSRSYENSMRNKQATNLTTSNASGSVAYPLGPNFPEKGDVKALRQFTGDVTLEGRWGNSIRLGSTTYGKLRQNYWSENTGSVGNPITIIRNGQGKPTDNIPWFPTVENINRDPSSIYLTQGQKIVIDDIQNNFKLTSLQVALEQIQTTTILVEQQLTSTDNTSAQEQDNVTHNITSRNIPT